MFMPRQTVFADPRPVLPVTEAEARRASRPATGLLSGSAIETLTGWQPVDRLRQGDLVQTLDGGLRPVRALNWRRVSSGGGVVVIPGGVLSNEHDLELLPDQRVMLDMVELEEMFDLPNALVKARDLVGLHGITRRPTGVSVEACEIGFDDEELVWVNGGICLHCAPQRADDAEFFETLSPVQARLLRLSLRGAAEALPLAA